MADDTQIEGLPEGATVRALQPEGETASPQPTADASKIEGLPEGSTVRALAPADTTQSTTGSSKETPSTPKPQSTVSKVWDAANKPLIPEGRAEKEGHALADSPPTLAESEHPILTGIKKGAAGMYADAAQMGRNMVSSPLGAATLGLGELGEAPGALGKVAKAGSRLAGLGFGAQGAEQAVEGATSGNLQKTLGGAGQAILGGTAGVRGTEMGEAPAKKALLAPVRGVGKAAGPISHALPTGIGLAAGEAMGHPWYGSIAGRMLIPREPIESFLSKGRTAGLSPEEANIAHLEDRVRDAEKAAKPAQEAYDAHEASRQQGIPAPEKIIKAHETAQKNLAEAQMHLDNAKTAAKPAPPVPADQPITPEAVAQARPRTTLGPPPVEPKGLPNLEPQEAPVEAPRAPQGVPGIAPETPKAEAAAPEAPKAEAPKEEPKGSPEDLATAHKVVSELPNEVLKSLGKTLGLDETKYDFAKREALREGGSKHPVERYRFAKDLQEKLPKKLVDALAEETARWDQENPHGFDEPSRSSKWRAERAQAIVEAAQARAEDSRVFDKGGRVGEPEKDKEEAKTDEKESKETRDKEVKPKKATPANASGEWSLWEN